MIDLVAIEQIKQLKHRYFRALDTGDLDALRACFTENATALFIGNKTTELEGSDKIVNLIAGHATSSHLVALHQGHHPEINITSDVTAEGIWYLQDMFLNLKERTTARGAAFYKDQYVKADGEWKIQHTLYERMYQETDKWGKDKEVTAHFLARKERGTQ